MKCGAQGCYQKKPVLRLESLWWESLFGSSFPLGVTQCDGAEGTMILTGAGTGIITVTGAGTGRITVVGKLGSTGVVQLGHPPPCGWPVRTELGDVPNGVGGALKEGVVTGAPDGLSTGLLGKLCSGLIWVGVSTGRVGKSNRGLLAVGLALGILVLGAAVGITTATGGKVAIGRLVGERVGRRVGGARVGLRVGAGLGFRVGRTVGARVGRRDDRRVGAGVVRVAAVVGITVGDSVVALVG